MAMLYGHDLQHVHPAYSCSVDMGKMNVLRIREARARRMYFQHRHAVWAARACSMGRQKWKCSVNIQHGQHGQHGPVMLHGHVAPLSYIEAELWIRYCMKCLGPRLRIDPSSMG
jgi:hypothetical protein